MFLSRLILNPRWRQTRRDLAEPYEMHRTLMRAFPVANKGGPGRVLFRVDVARDTGTAMVLVQSDKQPQWSALEPEYLMATPDSKPFSPGFTAAQRLVFRLRANPTIKTGTTLKADRLAGNPRSNGHRLGLVREEDQIGWLKNKGNKGGFQIVSELRGDGQEVLRVQVNPEGFSGGSKTADGASHDLTHLSVRFDGLLTVTDPDIFLKTVEDGVGAGKSFGFGLLSVARAEG